MSERDARVYLQDILDAINHINEYVIGLKRDDLLVDRKTLDAVVRNLEIIGEAAKQMPQDIIERFSDVPWRRMVNMRNKVIHEYSGVDVTILWQTIQEDLPSLNDRIKSILSELK